VSTYLPLGHILAFHVLPITFPLQVNKKHIFFLLCLLFFIQLFLSLNLFIYCTFLFSEDSLAVVLYFLALFGDRLPLLLLFLNHRLNHKLMMPAIFDKSELSVLVVLEHLLKLAGFLGLTPLLVALDTLLLLLVIYLLGNLAIDSIFKFQGLSKGDVGGSCHQRGKGCTSIACSSKPVHHSLSIFPSLLAWLQSILSSESTIIRTSLAL